MKSTLITIALGLCTTFIYATSQAQETAASAAAVETPAPAVTMIDTVVGTGAEAVAGTTVVVHYSGWLFDAQAANKHGKAFDSSVERGQPFSFPLGAKRVIRGWDQGVAGMKVGGKRTLIIPAALGYGARGAGNGVIPPNADLVFDVELLEVK
jgi:FKBP-type peptidyl-prolyl cis-trans isomerase FkpA